MRQRYVATIVAAVLVTACGGGAANDASDTPASTSSPTDGSTAAAPTTPSDVGADDAATLGEGESVTVRYASPLAGGSLVDSAKYWIEEVERRSNGRVEVEEFFAGALVPAAETVAGVRDGRADIAYISHAYSPSDFPLWEVAGIPFTGKDGVAHAATFMSLYESNEEFRDEFDRNNIVPLNFWPVDSGVVYSTSPVTTVEDLQGQKMRVVGRSAVAFSAVGVEPVAIDPNEMYEGLEREVFDSVTLTFESGPAYGLEEVVTHVVDVGLGLYASAGHVVNADFWASLPEDIQGLMQDVSAEMMAGKSAEILEAAGQATCSIYQEQGVDVSVAEEIANSDWATESQATGVDSWISDTAAATSMSEEELQSWHDEYIGIYESNSDESGYTPPVVSCASQAG